MPFGESSNELLPEKFDSVSIQFRQTGEQSLDRRVALQARHCRLVGVESRLSARRNARTPVLI